MAVGHDINFFSLDLTNTCWTRSLYGDRGTLLVLHVDMANWEDTKRSYELFASEVIPHFKNRNRGREDVQHDDQGGEQVSARDEENGT